MRISIPTALLAAALASSSSPSSSSVGAFSPASLPPPIGISGGGRGRFGATATTATTATTSRLCAASNGEASPNGGATTAAAVNGDGDDEPTTTTTTASVDRAPCLDGVCASDPLVVANGDDEADDEASTSSSHVGEATSRLGTSTGPTVWTEFGRLSQEHDVANLGQGFPDWLPPKFAVDCLVEAAMDSARSPHQYTRTAGHPALVGQLASRYTKHLGRDIDAMAEVAVTIGASQALYLSLQTLIKPGDEVILFEPFFDLYVNQVKLAGGTPVYVPLTFVPYDSDDSTSVTGGEWILEPEKLNVAISSKTRAIVLNSPHNPTGKVFTRSEMMSIADAVVKAGPQCVVLSDEVYKYIVHSPPLEEVDDADLLLSSLGEGTAKAPPSSSSSSISSPGHVHFASLPDMWDRTITISSAGKTFSATGWQVGWCVGPQRLISPIHQLLPYVQFCASTVIQEALARALPRADEPYEGHPSYYEYLKAKYTRKRDLLANALRRAGFAVPDWSTTPGGGFFIFARIGHDVADAVPTERLMRSNPAAPGGVARQDWALCQWMAEECGLLCIPSSPFFSAERASEGASDEFIRIAFCKQDETIERAAKALLDVRRRGGREVADGDDDDDKGDDSSSLKSSTAASIAEGQRGAVVEEKVVQ